ncbi:hypothetical protein GJ496_006562 [Pomphorhynchus laevis]|nr:hypothetical protein GJ496_006562 [Pomphorhynchus laevis]
MLELRVKLSIALAAAASMCIRASRYSPTGIGPTIESYDKYLKTLAHRLFVKRNASCADCIGWLRQKIGFALARLVSMCIRSARSALHRPLHSNAIHMFAETSEASG